MNHDNTSSNIKILSNIKNGKKIFYISFTTYLKDSNAYGNNYFAKYFEWQGVARESWFFNCIAPDFLQNIGVFITKTAHNDYIKETFPFQNITCKVSVRELRKASFYLDFTFFETGNENNLYSKGYQQIVFANKIRKISSLPDDVITRIKEFSSE
jgi:acyl-CoA thioesterase FadM